MVPLLGMAGYSAMLLAGGWAGGRGRRRHHPRTPTTLLHGDLGGGGGGAHPGRGPGIWKRPQLVNAAHVIQPEQVLGPDSWTVTVGVMTNVANLGLTPGTLWILR